MTHDEAKALGANYIDMDGDWWKVNGDIGYFMFKHEDKWNKYEFTDIQDCISEGYLKPL